LISVLRIGHRIERDKRITTHVCLVARAFGADEILIDTKDERIEDNFLSVCDRFGGDINIKSGVNARSIVKKWQGISVHLTMYGESLSDVMEKVDKKQDLLIVIGAEKVPAEFYELVDYNVSIGNQPHSEVAALAIFLDRYTHGSWQHKKFNGKMNIFPSKKGKDVRMRTKDEDVKI